MKEVIYTTEFPCKVCEKPARINLMSDDPDFPVDDKVKAEVLEWGQHYHWVDNHQLCAICGKFVQTGVGTNELNLIQTEVMQGDVHPDYIKATIHPDRGLLTVHSNCSKEMFETQLAS